MLNKPSMTPSLSDAIVLVNSLKASYNSHLAGRNLSRMSVPEHVISVLPFRSGVITIRAACEGEAVWVYADRKDPTRIPGSSPNDQLYYRPEKGWATQQSDPRGSWPHTTKMSLQEAVGHILIYIADHGPDRPEIQRLMEETLSASIPALDALFVMDS